MSRDRLIFNMGIPIPGKTVLILRQGFLKIGIPQLSISTFNSDRKYKYMSKLSEVNSVFIDWPVMAAVRESSSHIIT